MGVSQYLDLPHGRLAHEVTGEGPLVLLAHGLGDNRAAFRFLMPRLAAAGFRVASMDLRGHGQSTAVWPSYTRTDVAGDIAALIRHLGGPAVIIGHSYGGGAAAIVAAEHPELVTAIIQVAPGTRTPKLKLGDINGRFVKGISLILGTGLFRSPKLWDRYLRHAYPSTPNDFEGALSSLLANLREPGRMAATAKMIFSSPADAEVKLPAIACPALVVMGSLDPDFPSPQAEADGIVAAMPGGLGTAAVIDGAGHYPHTQTPEQVASVVLPFLAAHADA
ncbi:alpha/beta fold hydrolase [Catelliglobosispora koreensis]|uniref:alpha/beta fold hydrolase n=1 Tax=Catelliglobosispora koreensis TaxID=129052 RepID=UPI000380608B|nr:alpha/beta hydrolase [Catelliglobosispora koreensis]